MFCHLTIPIPIPIPSTGRAPASTAVPPRTAANAIAAARPAAVFAGVGRRSHKGEVDVDGLVEQLGVIGAVDGSAGFLEGWEFDECVSLVITLATLYTRHDTQLPSSCASRVDAWL